MTKGAHYFLNYFRSRLSTYSQTFSDIAALNDQITKLSIDVNTQALRIEIERTKRQKMRMVLEHIKRGITLPIDSYVEVGISKSVIVLNSQENQSEYANKFMRLSSRLKTIRIQKN